MQRHLFLFTCATALAWRTAAPAATCESLSKMELPSTVINHAEAIPGGAFTPPNGNPLSGLPAFCRVNGMLHPSADSHVEFEIWLPQAGWNGRLAGIGNGGFAGAIEYRGLAIALKSGYASASTDTGHRGLGTDASWALRHPERIVDFGYRAIHLTAATAKIVVRAFYGESPKRSYFNSCSNGGRQALMEAQRYPEDYDGIIAGAPANYWTHLLSNSVWDLQALLNDKESYIPAKKLKAIQSAALAACDALDGVKDNVIEDPGRCHFDPSVLLCKGADDSTCLSGSQIAALNKLYTGGRTSMGAQIFPGYSPGGEAEPNGWGQWITGNSPEHSLMFAFGTQFFKNMVYDDPAWDYHNFNADRDMQTADRKMAAILNATDADLSRFRKRGGKLILYHGWSDAAIAASATIEYYKAVQNKMGTAQTHDFLRLFMVPGMEHCAGGLGPSEFGQFSGSDGDTDHDIGAALQRWVEKGLAPERIVASQKQPAARAHPLCAYPLTAHYKGKGDTDDAANFVCSTDK